MGAWDTYKARREAQGADLREATLLREQRFLSANLPKRLSYHNAIIDGMERQVAFINSDNLETKTVLSLPGEDIPHGGLIEWAQSRWLVTQRDYNNEVYTKAIVRQCNYLLKWVDASGVIQQRWCIVEDGTKYLTGEWGDNEFVLQRGDSRIALTITKDAATLALTRQNRFIIDDYASSDVIAYRLTKPFRLGGSYGETGVLHFVLQECNTEDSDDLVGHIANYYDYFPRTNGTQNGTQNGLTDGLTDPPPISGAAGSAKKGWI